MCNGAEDTPANIKACLRKASDHFLLAMAQDWAVYSTDNSKKMQQCIRTIIKERGLKSC